MVVQGGFAGRDGLRNKRSRRAALAALLMTAGPVALTAAAPAQAQDAARSFDIPAQPLANALTAFGQQSGLQVSAQAPLLEGRTSQAVKGSLSSMQALSQMLVGTGLTFRMVGTTVSLEAAPQAAGGTVLLGPVRVEESGGSQSAANTAATDPQRPTGPGEGYVATRSLTATKTDTPIARTPQAISVVTSAQIAAQAAQSVPQALRYTSGVQAEQRGVNTDGEEYVFGRGFRLEEYLDGLILPDVSYNIASYEPYNLERVEVLHGPASVLFGQAYPGGIVNLVSKRPTADPLHEVQLSAGSWNRFQGAVDLGGPLDAGGDVLYRLTGVARHSDSQIDHVETERYSLAPAVTVRIDKDTDLTVLGNVQYDPKAGYYNFVPSQGTVTANPNGKVSTSLDIGDPSFDRHSRTQWGLGYMLEHRIGETWTLRQNLRYTHIRDSLDNVFTYGFQPDLRTLNRYTFTNHESLGQIAVDNQVQAKFSTGALEHTLLVGLDYRRIDYEERYGSDFAGQPTLDAFAPVYGQSFTMPAYSGDEDVGQDQLGLYAQDQIRVGKLDILAGLRQDWAGSTDHERISGQVTKQNDSKLTGRVGAVYSFAGGLSPYVSYATSFQPTVGTGYDGSAFRPTTGEQYEAGLKYQPTGLNAFATVSVFHLTQQNVTTPDPDPTHTGFSVQTGEIRSRGVEFELHAHPVPQLGLIATYTYLDNKVTKSNDTENAFGNNLGKRPFGVPRQQASGWADYTFDGGHISGLTLGAGVRYVGSTYGDSLNTFKVKASTLVDALASIDLSGMGEALEGWKLSVNASNLLDKRYVAYCQSASLCAFGLRRTVLGSLAYRW
ncbi:iron complex outermembrane receptor protein [Novosphingobium sp. PhB165]|nr:iron complex outermembrane receptor protein [Novosphingobium sp. PhB165]